MTANAQTKAPVTLICHSGNDVIGYRDGEIHIDPRNSTVNGYPATITAVEVRWTIEANGSRFTYTINRYTGTMVMNSLVIATGFRPAPVPGTCVAANERKF
jgi:hypothetical protein